MPRALIKGATWTLEFAGLQRDKSGILQGDRNVFTSSLVIKSWTVFLSDSPLHTDGICLKPKRVILGFWKDLTSDLPGMISKYAELGDGLLKSVRSDGSTAFLSSFKKTPIFKEYLHWYRTRDPLVFRYLESFCFFSKKAQLERPDQQTTAFCRWKGIEERLGGLDLRSSEHIPIIRSIIKHLLPKPNPQGMFLGRNGPGAVAGEERGHIQKSHNLRLSPKLKRLVAYGSPLRAGGRANVSLDYIETWFTDTEDKKCDGISRLTFVPKNYKTLRSICMEPTSVMFFQQGIRWELEEAIHNSLYGHFIDIHDQSRNREGALYGSATQNVDTTDLSDASDSVSMHLLRLIIPPAWLHLFLASRTTYVELPNGEEHRMNKYAPMGSALCFPVQSLIYASVVIYAYLRRFNSESMNSIVQDKDQLIRWIHRNIAKEWRVSSFCESFAVYGDDIICDYRVTDDVASILGDLGFIVNHDKSFVNGDSVRESCGIFAIDGQDVTPYRFSVKGLERRFDAESLASLIALTNRAGDFGYRNLHRFLTNFIKEWGSERGVNPIHFSSDKEESLAIYSRCPTNYHISKRNRREGGRFQRSELRVWKVVPRRQVMATGTYSGLCYKPGAPNADQYYDQYSLHIAYRASFLRDVSDDYVTPRGVHFGAKITWKWTNHVVN